MNAVDSEHKKNLQNDFWRAYQLTKSTADPGHPYSKFGTGDLRTLKEEPESKGVVTRDELLVFHKKYYSASNMRLVLYGTDPLPVLRAWAEEKFNGISDLGTPPPSFKHLPRPWGAAQLGRRLDVVPVKELMSVEVVWCLPPVLDLYTIKPLDYLSHLLGHEGKGSILALLRAKGWANELSAGEFIDGSDFAFFRIKATCTEKGMQRVEVSIV